MVVGRNLGVSVSRTLSGFVLKRRNNGQVFCIKRALNRLDWGQPCALENNDDRDVIVAAGNVTQPCPKPVTAKSTNNSWQRPRRKSPAKRFLCPALLCEIFAAVLCALCG